MKLLKKVLMPVAERFVSGESMESAIGRAKHLDKKGIKALINLLGEHVEDENKVESTVLEYDDILTLLSKNDINACISVKPTQLGLEIDYDYCMDNLKYLARRAESLGKFMWIDMESSEHTQETVEMYRELIEDYDSVGICIQCYLKRSEQDIENLLGDSVIRLVKGAYDESTDIAYRDRKKESENFKKLAEMLFESDDYFAIGTHDKELVDHCQQLMDEHNRPKDSFEFQFLKGVREDLKFEMAEKGFNVSEYVPYGPEWFSYYWRRVMERKENLLFALRAVLWGS
ncbi:MAG: proline dehydrogenase family protein [Candidatus Nanohaloarchaea archaeon]|nr:proline dehydrogenase family protein [Candidatus Nanohaloarchaea archaeon]